MMLVGMSRCLWRRQAVLRDKHFYFFNYLIYISIFILHMDTISGEFSLSKIIMQSSVVSKKTGKC